MLSPRGFEGLARSTSQNIARWDRLTTGSTIRRVFPKPRGALESDTTRAQQSSTVGAFFVSSTHETAASFARSIFRNSPIRWRSHAGDKQALSRCNSQHQDVPLHPLKYAGDAFIFNFDTSVTFMCDSRNQGLTILRFAALLLTRILNRGR